MAESLPKLDREKLMQELLVETERTVNEVADAVDDASVGCGINTGKPWITKRIRQLQKI